jgi:hypothetical protein
MKKHHLQRAVTHSHTRISNQATGYQVSQHDTSLTNGGRRQLFSVDPIRILRRHGRWKRRRPDGSTSLRNPGRSCGRGHRLWPRRRRARRVGWHCGQRLGHGRSTSVRNLGRSCRRAHRLWPRRRRARRTGWHRVCFGGQCACSGGSAQATCKWIIFIANV